MAAPIALRPYQRRAELRRVMAKIRAVNPEEPRPLRDVWMELEDPVIIDRSIDRRGGKERKP